MKSSAFQRRARILVIVGLALVIIVAYAILYLDHLTSLAVVRGGIVPGLVSFDLGAFSSVFHQEKTASELLASGKVAVVPEGTECLVIVRRWQDTCQGPLYHPFKVTLLNGSFRGKTAWICSDSLQMTHPWL